MHGWSARGALAALLAVVAVCSAHAQTFFINENFSTASGSTPPAGWTNDVAAGNPAVDVWRFNNPSGRETSSSFTAPYAIFDADAFSNNSLLEHTALTSASVSTIGYNYVRLKWDSIYEGGLGLSGVFVEIWDGSAWNIVRTNQLQRSDPPIETGTFDIDVSAVVANEANVRVRFRFLGDHSSWWIVDNVQLYGLAATPAYLLEESFDSATPGTPPAGWTSNVISGDPAFDFWRFAQSGVFDAVGNPGSREYAGMTGRAAIFDSDVNSSAGGTENVALASPSVSTAGRTQLSLTWDQYYGGGYQSTDRINVEVWNGSVWSTVYAYTDFANNLEAKVTSSPNVDVTSVAANLPDVRVRFRYVGNWSWWWIVDNVRLISTSTLPVVTSVSVPANATYSAGQDLDFTVNWSEAVTVLGTPQIALTIGAGTVNASYVSGSGTSALVFRYTVAAADLDLDGIAVGSAIGLDGGAIQASVGGVAATLALGGLPSTAGVIVRTQYVVTSSAGLNGTIDPLGSQPAVDHGSMMMFTVTPGAGYAASVAGTCGGSLASTTYTTGQIVQDCTVEASFTATAVTTYSAPSATGTGMITASFTGGGPTCTYTTSQFIPVTGHPASPPRPARATFRHGLFDFRLGGCAPGSTITMTITYPAALAEGTRYWKYGPTPSQPVPDWYLLPATIVGNTATFTITDGGLGDDDLAANGAIIDQGGPGVGLGPPSIPTLSAWMLAVLASLLLLVGMRRRPR